MLGTCCWIVAAAMLSKAWFEEVGDLRWRREWVGELGVLQDGVWMRKLEMNAVDADVGLARRSLSCLSRARPFTVKVACSASMCRRKIYAYAVLL
jgi:hypothetical protein